MHGAGNELAHPVDSTVVTVLLMISLFKSDLEVTHRCIPSALTALDLVASIFKKKPENH
jgi:hypothetical protein